MTVIAWSWQLMEDTQHLMLLSTSYVLTNSAVIVDISSSPLTVFSTSGPSAVMAGPPFTSKTPTQAARLLESQPAVPPPEHQVQLIRSRVIIPRIVSSPQRTARRLNRGTRSPYLRVSRRTRGFWSAERTLTTRSSV